MTLNQWKNAHGWRLPIVALNELDTLIAQRETAALVQVCCGEYATCIRACTPRGNWLAQQKMADMPVIGCVQHDCAECRAREAAKVVPAEPALNPATCEHGGVTYFAKEKQGCEGCAAETSRDLCLSLIECGGVVRPDGKYIIWVKEQA